MFLREIINHSKGTGFHSWFLNWTGQVIETKIHDLSLEGRWYIDKLKYPDRISFNSLMLTRSVQISNQGFQVFADEGRVGDDCFAEWPGGALGIAIIIS